MLHSQQSRSHRLVIMIRRNAVPLSAQPLSQPNELHSIASGHVL